MRTRSLFMTLVLSLAVGAVACGGNDNTPAQKKNQDAGTDAMADAGTDGGGGTTDGGTTDGGGGNADTGTQDTGTQDTGTTSANTITADDQALAAADSNKVTIASAHVESDGFVVIHADDGSGHPGDVIGSHLIQAGDNSDVVVTLDRNVKNGETLYAMLHGDTNSNGTYDFVGAGDEDGPLTDDNGDPITDAFTVNLPSVSVSDNTLSDLSTQVSVHSAYSDGAGFVVIHENDCSNFGDVIGHAALSDGANADVTVTLDRPATDGETLCAMLHTDTGTAGDYEFDGTAGSEDAPVKLADDTIVMHSFKVSLDGDVPAVRITISANGTQSYQVDSVKPDMYDNGLSSAGGNPTLQFNKDWRYEIDNTVKSAHPFEFIKQGLAGTPDTVQLSQKDGVDGAYESNTSINWVEDGDNVRFTIAGGAWSTGMVAPQINGYRCAVHTQTMRGDITAQ